MISETPKLLLILIVVLTMLGLVMGYCIAMIRLKSKASLAIKQSTLELENKFRVTQGQLIEMRGDRDRLKRDFAVYKA